MSKLSVTIEGYTFEVEVDLSASERPQFQVKIDGQPVQVMLPELGAPVSETEWVIVDRRPYEVVLDGELRWVKSHRGLYAVEVRDQSAPAGRAAGGSALVKAPIPGQITRVLVAAGQAVEAGQPLVVLEAMKMENEIHAARAGVVKALHVSAGQGVKLGQPLVEIG